MASDPASNAQTSAFPEMRPCFLPSNETMRAEFPDGKGTGVSPHPQYFDAYEYLPPLSALKLCRAANDSTNLQRLQAYESLCSPRSTDSRGAQGIISGGHPPGKTLLELSEDAVALAARGLRQTVGPDQRWIFASACNGNWSCLFTNYCHVLQHGRRSPSFGVKLDHADFLVEGFPLLSLERAYNRGLMIAFALEAQVIHGPHGRLARRVEALLEPVQRHSIGMHVRRGDACETFVRPSAAWESGHVGPMQRPCYALVSYVAAARRLRERYGKQYRNILLMTDSADVIEETSNFSDFSWQFLSYNRKVVGGDDRTNLNTSSRQQRVYIEDRARLASANNVDSTTLPGQGMFDSEEVLATELADLRFVSSASMFVGTSRSFTSLAVQMLMWAARGNLPPMISLSGPPLHSMLKIRGGCGDWGGVNPASSPRQTTIQSLYWRWYPCAYAHQPGLCARGAVCRTSRRNNL